MSQMAKTSARHCVRAPGLSEHPQEQCFRAPLTAKASAGAVFSIFGTAKTSAGALGDCKHLCKSDEFEVRGVEKPRQKQRELLVFELRDCDERRHVEHNRHVQVRDVESLGCSNN